MSARDRLVDEQGEFEEVLPSRDVEQEVLDLLDEKVNAGVCYWDAGRPEGQGTVEALLVEAEGQLSALTSLDLSNNRLSQLPAQLGHLSALTRLFLSNNRLSQLPAELAQLSALTQLFLSINRVSQLPAELGQLSALTQLYLHDNPGLNLPPEVLGPTWEEVSEKKAKPAAPAAILAHYFAERGGDTRPLNEVKMILVGRGGAGKTATVIGC